MTTISGAMDASRPQIGLPVRLTALIAIAMLAMVAMTGTTRADDDDAYFDCVIGKAEAIMKRQAKKNAAAALEKAYALCQPIELSQDTRLRTGLSAGGIETASAF